MLKKSFPIRDRFIAEHKAEYDDFMAIAMRLQASSTRDQVSTEDRLNAEAFRERMIEAGCEKTSIQVLDRAIY